MIDPQKTADSDALGEALTVLGANILSGFKWAASGGTSQQKNRDLRTARGSRQPEASSRLPSQQKRLDMMKEEGGAPMQSRAE
jgi:hypothetical protein